MCVGKGTGEAAGLVFWVLCLLSCAIRSCSNPFFYLSKAFDLIKPFSQKSGTTRLLFMVGVCQRPCVIITLLEYVAALASLSALWRDILCCAFRPGRAWRILNSESNKRGESNCPWSTEMAGSMEIDILISHFGSHSNSGACLETTGAIFLQKAKILWGAGAGVPR